ncbi:general odorant-binding protein 70 [Harmonia axyridis]|uniref:general odorant-binding protein 70 n=1 Tax=Harmonia axyridis TaxID=115357 RepID=UPI001E277A9D|nr:general odorant-binding protein 70 [Harmonia axyridis]
MYGKILFVVAVCAIGVLGEANKTRKCNIPPTAPKRIEKVINQCQDEIKVAILAEALQAASVINSNKRSKRETFTAEEKRIAGCLLHCVYRKMKAVNDKGFPTVEGLVSLYTEGIEDKEYILATLQSVNVCLAKAQKEFITTPQSLEVQGKTCEIAYDVFDCVSEKIGEYCGQTP